MAGNYGEIDTSLAGFGQGNVGFSGTPMWKLKQQGVIQNQAEMIARNSVTERQVCISHVLMETASMGGVEPPARPFVRHVLVKDLRKVAARAKLALPTTGLFGESTSVGLFVLFDGQSCADQVAPGPNAAEWCCKNVHMKLIRNLASLPPDQVNQTFLKATLIKTFEDLDHDLLVSQPGIQDGCGAALALLVGEYLFTAVLGKCDAVLCSRPDGPSTGRNLQARSLGSKQGRCKLPDEQKWLVSRGGVVFQGHDCVCVREAHSGSVAAVSRSLGDRNFKVNDQGLIGVEGAATLLRCVPEVNSTHLSYEDATACPYLVLMSSPVTENVPPDAVAGLVMEFAGKPRACSGEIAGKAAEALSPGSPCSSEQQCTTVTLWLRPSEIEVIRESTIAEPAAKKAKVVGLESMRIRHILVRYRDCGVPHDPVRNKPVIRSQQEAELILRRALKELLQDARATASKGPAFKDPKKAAAAYLTAAPAYLKLCKALSECETASKGGGMCGDLGWVRTPELKGFGQAFEDIAKGLAIGQWSDLVPSPNGLHVMQRIA